MNWKDINTGHLCPICGLALDFIPWDQGVSSQEICSSCGNQFGYSDASPTAQGVIKRWRERRVEWIANGMKWKHDHPEDPFPQNHPPQNWNPREQLKNIPKEFLGEDENY